MSGFGGEQRSGNGFQVAHFADQNHVGILTQSGAQGGRKVCSVHFDFALVDEAALVAVQKLDGVFDGDQVIGARRVDAVNHRGKRGGLTGAGSPRDQHQAALLFANLGDDRRKVQFFRSANLGRNDAQNHADVAALLKNVDAEAAQAGHAVSHIELGSFFELLFLPVGHHAEGHGKHFFRRNAGHFGDGIQHAVHAQVRVVADFEVQVRSLLLYGAAKKIVNVQCHKRSSQSSVFGRQLKIKRRKNSSTKLYIG